LASRLNIAKRHICRNFETRHEAPRSGNSNPDLSAVALRMALEEAQLKIGDLAYLIGHTTSRRASSRRTYHLSQTALALRDLTWNGVKRVPASRTRS